MRNLYCNRISSPQLFAILSARMNEDELIDAMRTSAYMLAVIEKREQSYQHRWPWRIVSAIQNEESTVTSEETITLNPFYKITLCTLDIKSQKLALQFSTHQLLLWRDGQPQKIFKATLENLHQELKKELEKR